MKTPAEIAAFIASYEESRLKSGTTDELYEKLHDIERNCDRLIHLSHQEAINQMEDWNQERARVQAELTRRGKSPWCY